MPITALPVLDLRLAADPATAEQFRTQLRAATHEVGFFYLVGHGLTRELQEELVATARRFFALPDADKKAIENLRSPHFRGYTRLGGELTQGQTDWREQIDIGPERESRIGRPGAVDWDILEGPNQWPAALPELREVVERWQATLEQTALTLLREWAQSLGQDRHVFDPAFATDPSTLIKIVRYPGREDRGQGVGAHKDSGVLTLLFVEPGKGGLQVEHEGEWVDAPPVEDALIVNIGELLEVATGGYLIATNHRVVSPPAGEDRISIPFFFNPALSERIPTLELSAGLAAESRGVTVDADNPIHDTYGANALKSRLRAHPDVAAIHHPVLAAARS
ncbi:isopenicillin N synthase family dioxygenase [Actinomycetota bacterium]